MSEGTVAHNAQCTSESHREHLCYLMSQGFHLSDAEEFNALTDDPKFCCDRCGRKANADTNLCVPIDPESLKDSG